MIYPRSMLRRAMFGSIAIIALATPAFADERVECAKAYESAQRLQQKSELIGAYEAAERCARPTCPALLRDECTQWTTSIKQKTPQLISRVKASDGCIRTDAKVEAAGHRRVENAVLYVDPGVHEITITDPVSGRVKTETIDFAAGEKRDIDVDFAGPGTQCAATSATPEETPKRSIPTTTLILGGVGAGLIVTGVTLGLIGSSKRSDLEACKGNCASDDVDSARTFFVAGDVLAGIGVLALGVAAVTYFASSTKPASAR